MGHPSDPVETPPPRRVGADLDGAIGGTREPTGSHQLAHECLHLELIDDVRQARKRRGPLTIAILGVSATAILAVAAVLYGQGQAAGAATVRLDAIEARASEDRASTATRERLDHERAAAAAIRETEHIEALHALDLRLGRIEEQLRR